MRTQRLRWEADTGWRGGDGAAADLILYFGPTEAIAAAAPALAALFPGALALGCSTAAAIRDHAVVETGAVAVACRFEGTTLRLAEAELPDTTHSAEAGARLGAALRGEGLAGMFLLSDGMEVNGSAVAAAAAKALGGAVPISGGLAADGARFLDTAVGTGGIVRPRRVAALGFYGGALRLAQSSAGGWKPFGPRRVITRSDGCVLRELDGKPALALYERYLGAEAAGLPGTALLFPLMVWDPAARSPDGMGAGMGAGMGPGMGAGMAHGTDDGRAGGRTRVQTRTVLSIDRAAGTMTFAGEIPQGWGAQLMHGSFDSLVEGAARAGEGARAGFGATRGDTLAVLVSCVGRRMLLGQRTDEELYAVETALGADVVRIGFYSHGEIAADAAAGSAVLQNQTMVVTMLAEAA